MERLRSLNLYQKAILFVMVVMTLIFSVIYPRTIGRVGYLYHDAILVPGQENGNTVYTGQVDGQPAQFVVSGGNAVTLECGRKTYGPYTITEDPSAVPKNDDLAGRMRGIEIRSGDALLFRGGVLVLGTHDFFLYNEDGTIDYSYFTTSATAAHGLEPKLDENGNVIDPLRPSVYTVYELLNDPPLTHKGHAEAWFLAVFLCVLNTLSIFFADEIFRFHLAFQLRDADHAEPSDLVIAGRYFSWTAFLLLALILFIKGLQ